MRIPVRLLAAVLLPLAAAVAVGAVVLTLGADRRAAPAVAGGYDLPRADACLGPAFDLAQSGRFVDLSSAGGAGGSLELRDGVLSGTVACAGGGEQPLRAQVAPGGDGAVPPALTGTVGGRPLRVSLARTPPEPGEKPPAAPGSANGDYRVAPRSACLGDAVTLSGGSSSPRVRLSGRDAGTLAYRDGALSGEVTCLDGSRARIEGSASPRAVSLTITGAAAVERVRATEPRSAADTAAAVFLAIVVVMAVTRLVGSLLARIGQPRVMGEVLAGILMGPTLLGAVAPGVSTAIFPPDIIPHLSTIAELGLVFFMFLIGMEIDLGRLRGRVGQTMAVASASVALPMALGLVAALATFEMVGPPTRFAGYALFVGVSLSITAFPVLARLLVERRMLGSSVGTMAVGAAAINDVIGWFLVALAAAVAGTGSGADVVRTILLALAFTALMIGVVRPLLARAATAYEGAGRLPVWWTSIILGGVLLAAYATDEIGISVIFGGFLLGAVMPRHAGLTEDVTHRMEDLVLLLLLPLFFVVTGLRTDVGLLGRPELIVLTAALTAVAIVGKLGGAFIAARTARVDAQEAAVLGTLMNTRGLTELVVLTLALTAGVITDALFAALVVMALVTTFMTAPLLRLIDPRDRFAEPVTEAVARARDATAPAPSRAILVTPIEAAATAQLTALAAPLAASQPPRELILARAVRPPRGATVRGGLQSEEMSLAAASAEAQAERRRLAAAGVAARAVAYTSAEPGADAVRLAADDGVDLLLLDGRRPLLGGAVPRGEVGAVLDRAPCDVGVLVAPDDRVPALGPGAAVAVPFGGGEHDWAALELGAWIAAATGGRLVLLGTEAQGGGERDASRLLANASLLVQRLVGVAAEPLLAPPGARGILDAADDAALLVVGLSERWRDEGLGATRTELARHATAPLLFVRRGARAGALAPREDVTRFGWSIAATDGPGPAVAPA
ncbi:MAG: cation:proton antiporter [Thermoleophilia bacterium]